jgi:protein TonB
MLFSKSDIYAKEWMDVIFAGRNKEYGAYELRILAPKATNLALGVVVLVVVGLSGIAYSFSNNSKIPNNPPQEDMVTVTIDNTELPIEMEPPVVPDPIEQDAPKQVAQDVSSQDLIKFTEINATDASRVTEDMTSTEDVMDRKKLPANITMDGVKGGELVPRGTFGSTKRDGAERGRAVGSLTGGDDGEGKPFISVEVMPEPPGGMKAFVNWVAQNYDFPQSAVDNGAKGVIQVSFVVEKDGSLSSFEVKRDMGFGTGDAAIRLLKKAKKWSPGIQNGLPVRVAYTLPIRLSTIDN